MHFLKHHIKEGRVISGSTCQQMELTFKKKKKFCLALFAFFNVRHPDSQRERLHFVAAGVLSFYFVSIIYFFFFVNFNALEFEGNFNF